MKGLEIKGLVEASFCDWDGRISAVVFLPRCNLRCPFCQNGDLVLRPERLASVGLPALKAYLERTRQWIDGVVVTGGEPTIWDDLEDFLGEIKTMGLGVKLDTNGTRPDRLGGLVERGLVDYVAMDVKAPLDGRYAALAGVPVDLKAIRGSISLLTASPALDRAHELRTTLVPGLVGEAEIVAIGEAIAGADRWALQQFVPENSLAGDLRRAVPYSDEFINHLLEKARPYVRFCFFRGRAAARSPGGG